MYPLSSYNFPALPPIPLPVQLPGSLQGAFSPPPNNSPVVYQNFGPEASLNRGLAITGRQDAAQRFMRLGQQYYDASRFHHAVMAFNQSLKLEANNFEAYNKRGVAKVGIRDYAGAFTDYSQAIRLKPNCYGAYINRGNLWVFLGDMAQKLGNFKNADQHYQLAMDDYNQAIRLNPVRSAAYENRSELYSNLGFHAKSLQDKAMIIQLQKLTPQVSATLPYCPPRIALILANDDYEGTENDLNGGPLKDANGMAKILESQGFTVIRGFNLNGNQMKAKVSEFIAQLNQNPGAISLTYYSGHGGSIQGNNYLIPSNFTGSVNPDFEANSVSIDYLLKQLKYSRSYFNMIFLDACRTPLTEGTSFKSGRPIVKQWETEPGPALSNTWVEYASRPKMPALQNGNEGLYTKYLMKYMVRPDLNLKEVSMYTSYALENDPIANQERQHARTQTDLSQTGPIAQSFYFAKPCKNPGASHHHSLNPFNLSPTVSV